MPWKINGKQYGDVAGDTIYVTSKINGVLFINYKTVNGRYLPFCYRYQVSWLGMPPFDPPSDFEYTNCDGGTENGQVNVGEMMVEICCFIDSINVTGGPEIGITLTGTDGCEYYL